MKHNFTNRHHTSALIRKLLRQESSPAAHTATAPKKKTRKGLVIKISNYRYNKPYQDRSSNAVIRLNVMVILHNQSVSSALKEENKVREKKAVFKLYCAGKPSHCNQSSTIQIA